MAATVRYNPARSRFEFDVDGETAITVYRRDGNILTLTHTETPARLRGRGIGGRMVAGVLGYAREHGLKVVPRCPFVQNYIAQHPEFHDLLA